jgi:hypothetical protein
MRSPKRGNSEATVWRKCTYFWVSLSTWIGARRAGDAPSVECPRLELPRLRDGGQGNRKDRISG